MKRIWILFLLFFIAKSGLLATPFIVQGHASPGYRDTLSLFTIRDIADEFDFDMKKLLVSAEKPDSKGNFSFRYDLKKLQSFYLKSGGYDLIRWNYFGPGDSLFIEIGDTQTTFSGSGAKNIFYKDSTDKLGISFYDYRKTGLRSDSFLSLIDHLDSATSAYLTQFSDKNHLSREYIDHQVMDNKYHWKGQKLKYLWMHYAMFHKDGFVKVEPDYFDFINPGDLRDKDAVNNGNYLNFLQEYPFELWEEKWLHSPAPGVKRKGVAFEKLRMNGMAKILDSLYSGEFRYLARCELVDLLIIWAKHDEGETRPFRLLWIDSFFKFIEPCSEYPDSNIYSRLKGKYLKINALENTVAPGFTLNDLNDKPVSLSDFKGKVVLLDLWAIGCVPCIQAVPYSNKLQDSLSGKLFKLLNICLAGDDKSWKKIIEKFEWHGTHLLYKKGENVAEKYFVDSYPKYILIDKKGIIRSTSIRLGQDGLKEEIEKLMAE